MRDEATVAVLGAFAAAPGDDEDPRVRARAAITAAWTLLTDDPRKGRILLIEALADERQARQRRETWMASAQILAGLARDHCRPKPR